MNHVTLIGRIVRNLELRTSVNGKSFVYFTLAISDPLRKDHTDFINCVSWNKTAENMVKFVGKGSLISVVGKLSVRKDNRDQTITEVITNEVTFLENRKKDYNDNIGNRAPKNVENPKKTVNIDEALNSDFDTEISFINNKNIDNDDDDEAIIWDN